MQAILWSKIDGVSCNAGADGDGKVTREQFEELMKSPVVAKPNLLNRVSMAGGGSLPRWSMAPPAPSPFDNMVEMPEDDEDEEEPAPAPAAPVPIPAPPTRQGSSNPVQSLMSGAAHALDISPLTQLLRDALSRSPSCWRDGNAAMMGD